MSASTKSTTKRQTQWWRRYAPYGICWLKDDCAILFNREYGVIAVHDAKRGQLYGPALQDVCELSQDDIAGAVFNQKVYWLYTDQDPPWTNAEIGAQLLRALADFLEGKMLRAKFNFGTQRLEPTL